MRIPLHSGFVIIGRDRNGVREGEPRPHAVGAARAVDGLGDHQLRRSREPVGGGAFAGERYGTLAGRVA